MAENDPEGLKEAIDNSSLTDEARKTLRYKKEHYERWFIRDMNITDDRRIRSTLATHLAADC